MPQNTLYYGDNLDILRQHIADESIDLIYLDPPFNSKANYNVLFSQQDGSRAASQLKAFGDTWKWDQAAAATYEQTVERGGQVSKALQAFRQLLGTSNMLAYLTMMAPRLLELRRVLKSTGSIYLHCDPTASHYLKVLMDAAFGTNRFLNEIAWCHYGGGQSKRWFPRKHDTLLLYHKGGTWTFNTDAVRVPYESDYKSTVFGKKDDPDQRVYLPNPKGKVPEDFWIINRPYGEEVLGYPTQKPEALLERIILASSNPADLVLDPFCGCGTTVAVAQRLSRRWIGIDIAQPAMKTIKKRFADTFPEGVDIRVIGEPVTVPDAQALAKSDPYQFQWWALGLVDARPEEERKGADKGIDGILPFHDEEQGPTKHVVLSVKAGAVDASHIRDLRGVVEREGAELGALITMQEPTQPMRTEAASAGFYRGPWHTHHPKIQILTIAELLAGKGLDLPPVHRTAAFRRAPKARRDEPGSQTQMEL